MITRSANTLLTCVTFMALGLIFVALGAKLDPVTMLYCFLIWIAYVVINDFTETLEEESERKFPRE